MKGQTPVVRLLNQVLTAELTSINQYFLHARICKNWGLIALDKVMYRKSILDMKQSDSLIERILFLEALPNLQMLGALRIGEDTAEILDCNRQLEEEQTSLLKAAIVTCEQAQDFVSRELLVAILDAEEEHLDWIETQHYQITHMGLENYLAAQVVAGD
ncbi:MAG: bacterioferritin [Pseudomonadales bacterium]|nr:bacterioferritin [Pseudomonadales bacterium]